MHTPPPSARPSIKQQIRYRFDNTIARGSGGLIAWLAVVTILLIVVAGLIVWVAGIGPAGEGALGFWEGAWRSLMRTLDPGTMGGDEGGGFRAVALAVTIGGILIVSTLIGLITSAIDQRLEELRKGRSEVLESNHTLILGWSEKLHSVISELIVANENQRDAVVVVLAPVDKVTMDDEIRARTGRKTGPTRIICRTGDPTDPADLALVRPAHARSTIVLAPEGDESPDAQVVKVVLGLMQYDRELASMNVTAELTEQRNAAALRSATRDGIRTVVSTDLIARVTAQVCRQTGLSMVYQELLDFDGDEIYFASLPNLTGATYGQALLSCETSSVIGLRRGDGIVALNPPMETVIAPDDRIVAISEDDDTVVAAQVDTWRSPDAGTPVVRPQRPAEHTLVLGWNHIGPHIMHELDGYMEPGSSVEILVDHGVASIDADWLADGLRNMEATVRETDTSDPARLAHVLGERDFDHLMILCYRDTMPAAEADARALLTLLQVRQVLTAGHRNEHIGVVTELLDVRAVELARIANPDDFVVSERLVSLLLAQLSENAELHTVFEDLLDAGGCEINLAPMSDYVPVGQQTSYGELVSAARNVGQTAIGFRTPGSDDADSLGAGVLVNPAKSRLVTPRDEDRLIVISRDAT